MPRKKKSGAAAWVDRDDAPELTEKFFDRAEIRDGDKIIRRGRPPLPNPKQAVKQGMIRKSGNRFSEKIMPQRKV